MSGINPPSPKRTKRTTQPSYVSITSHPGRSGVSPIEVKWGELNPENRGPIICTTTEDMLRNAIGAHSGSYCVYRALAVASGALNPSYKPIFHNTEPAKAIGPFPSWGDPKKIATIDPFGAVVTTAFKKHIVDEDIDVRPTIAVTRAHIDLPELKEAIKLGRLTPDGKILTENGQANVTKAAVEPVYTCPKLHLVLA